MIRIDEDFSHVGGGYANLWVAGQLPPEPFTLTIRRRAPEPHCLGPNGWQVNPADLAPESAEQQGHEVCLLLGPDICDEILEETEVEIVIDALRVRRTFVWPYIAPAVDREKRTGSFIGQEPKTTGTTSPGGPGTTQSPGQLGPTTSPGAPGTTRSPGQPATPPIGGGEGHEGGKEPPGTPVTPPGNPDERSSPALVYAVIAGLVICAAGAIYWFASQQDPEPEPDPTVVAEDLAPTETDQPLDDPEDVEEDPPTSGDTTETLMAEAQECLTNSCGGPEFFAIAERLQAIDDYDNALRLADIAARNGEPLAHLWIARLYDPLQFELKPGGPGEASAERALSRYRQAVAAGATDGAEDLEALCIALLEAEGSDDGPLAGMAAADAQILHGAHCDS